MARQATWEDYQQRVGRSIHYLENNLDGDLSLAELARAASFSPCHFHRIFRALTGEGVAEHVRRLRLERAAARLRSSGKSILEIALEAGYEAHESFTRAFETAFHESPSRYRTKQDLRAQSAVPDVVPEIASRIERIGPLNGVRLRHVGPYDEVGQTFTRLAAWVGAHALFGPWTQGLGVVYDDPEVTPPERLRYDAAFTVPRAIPGEGDIQGVELPARDYATAVHQGPYSGLAVAYASLMRWWLRHGDGEISDAPALEFYLNQPGQTPPESLLTRICLPIAR
ncbi:MAG TPA: AraC family transcriptional regulator [Bryobacteraceae bacterium]|nr:AraC family transcriptional regulator [Bryobacteraceae bacterium]